MVTASDLEAPIGHLKLEIAICEIKMRDLADKFEIINCDFKQVGQKLEVANCDLKIQE